VSKESAAHSMANPLLQFYDRSGVLVTDRYKIARHYASTWFLVDLISVFPHDIIFIYLAGVSNDVGLSVVSRSLRALKARCCY
jgi:hypothetical protein